MKAKIKSKVKAKAAAVKAKAKGIKAKVKGKCKGGKCKACAALVAALCAAVLLGGCAEARPASRATTATYGDFIVKFSEGCSSNYVSIVVGDGAIASADSAGSTETQTATPTTDVKPDVNVDVPVTKGAAANAAADLINAAAHAPAEAARITDLPPTPARPRAFLSAHVERSRPRRERSKQGDYLCAALSRARRFCAMCSS